jgi:hypothetical protein
LGNPVRLVSFELDRGIFREARLISLFRVALSFSDRQLRSAGTPPKSMGT